MRTLPAFVLAVLFMVSLVCGLIARRTIERNADMQSRVCRHLQWDLEAITRNASARADLRARMVYHHLDESLTVLCLNKSFAASASTADACWTSTGKDDCYLQLAEQLLDAYRRR